VVLFCLSHYSLEKASINAYLFHMLMRFIVIFSLLASAAFAQETRRRRALPKALETPQNFTPAGTAAPVISILPSLNGPPSLPPVAAGKAALSVRARYGGNGPMIMKSLQWRVFMAAPNQDGSFTLVGESAESAPIFVLEPGQYIIHTAYGMAVQARKVELKSEGLKELFTLNAGALLLNASVGDKNLAKEKLTFDIFTGSQFEGKEPQLLMRQARAGQPLILPEGTYHIVSLFGDANATVRSDVKVQTGKITDATLHHRAAEVSFRLMRGGGIIANAAWTIMNPGGDVIKEALGDIPALALLEGDYNVLARYEGRVFSAKFSVEAGKNINIDVDAK
jgi:hypothetical protein